MTEPDWEAVRRPDLRSDTRLRRARALVVVLAGLALVGFLARGSGSGGASDGVSDGAGGRAMGDLPVTGALEVRTGDPSGDPSGDPLAAEATPSPTPSPAPRPTPRPTASPRPRVVPAAGEWAALPDAPLLTRASGAAAWTSAELLVWGGSGLSRLDGTRAYRDDGAAYDPATGAWRVLAASPLAARDGVAAAWTGTELLVWGGQGRFAVHADGAAYDPVRDRWRALPPAPLSPRSAAAAVWTGTELLILGGVDNAGSLADGAAYDPARDAWRAVAALPEEVAGGHTRGAVWAGDAAVVWSTDGPGPVGAARYDPAGDAWRPMPAAPGAFRSMVWADGELLGVLATAPSQPLNLQRLAPGAEWERVASPLLENYADAAVAWTGAAVHLLPPIRNGGVAYDPAMGAWTRLPPPPQPPPGPESNYLASPSVVWTGAELLVVGGDSGTTGPLRAAAWRPAPPS